MTSAAHICVIVSEKHFSSAGEHLLDAEGQRFDPSSAPACNGAVCRPRHFCSSCLKTPKFRGSSWLGFFKAIVMIATGNGLQNYRQNKGEYYSMLYVVMIATGAFIGWVTNVVAIWLLFHPYDPIYVGPWHIQGLLPRRQADIARSIGQLIEKNLFNPADLKTLLQKPSFYDQLSALISKQPSANLKTLTSIFASSNT